MRCPVNASAVTCVRCASSSCTAAARPADPLPEPDQRIHDDRRAGDDDQRELRSRSQNISAANPMTASPSRRRSPTVSETACWIWLHVVGDARHQLTARAAAEEAGRLIEDVAEQLVAEVADDALADVRHQVGREVRAEALEEIDHEDRDAPGPEVDADAAERDVRRGLSTLSISGLIRVTSPAEAAA